MRGAAPGGAVLVVNAGSSSIKACLLAPDGSERWRDQRAWRPGDAHPSPHAAEALLEEWLGPVLAGHGSELELIGHRVVHGAGASPLPPASTGRPWRPSPTWCPSPPCTTARPCR
ncbi:MAG: hypothetical protein VKI81_00350 [Synechococcaceae cyanobacterium]|nr:hypothetical protein [Synechococcaceae cyanobacterium]